MKRVRKLFSLLLVLFLITGCMKYNSSMVINEQGDVDFALIFAISNQALEEESSFSGGITEEDKTEYEKLGFKVEDYKDSEWTGSKITKTYNVEKASSKEPVEVHLDKIFEEEITVLCQSLGDDKYKAHFVLEGDSSENGQETLYPDMDLEDLKAFYDISYSVTLPSTPISHNADKVEGNTLTWKLNLEGKTDIQYEFELKKDNTSNNVSNSNSATNSSDFSSTVNSDKKDNSMLWIIIGIACAGVIAIIVVIAVVISKRKKNTNVMNQSVPVQPMANNPTMTPNSFINASQGYVSQNKCLIIHQMEINNKKSQYRDFLFL